MPNWMLIFVAMIVAENGARAQIDPVEERLQTLVETLRENKHKIRTQECKSVVSSIMSDVKTMSERLDHCKLTQDPKEKHSCEEMTSTWPKVLDFYTDIVSSSCKLD